MNLQGILEERGVQVAPPSHKHWKEGWIHVDCPFCGDSDFHLGIPEVGGRLCRCFKCGRHETLDALSLILRMGKFDIRRLLFSDPRGPRKAPRRVKEARETSEMDNPRGTLPLDHAECSRHREYLKSRAFDPSVISKWGVMGTCAGVAASGLRPWSLFIPAMDETGKLVSWQERDITGEAEAKYKTSNSSAIKLILYGLHLVPIQQRSIVVVEGVTSVWILGAGEAVATFGQDWSPRQLLILAKRFDNIVILFDPEDEAQQRAQTLSSNLKIMGRKSVAFDMREAGWKEEDPAEVSSGMITQLLKDCYRTLELSSL